MNKLIAACLLFVPASALAADGPITLESLLKEMTDREAIACFPDPAYTCRQFSSYDRRSTTPDNAETWFANHDVDQYLRVEDVNGPDAKTHKEWVMADTDGPGALVRIWSANPAGTIRIYLDNAEKPTIETSMADLLGGKWKVAPPLSQECSKGWNLYLPIPYAKHCKITSDAHEFYYQVNYRTYAPGSSVESLADVDKSADAIAATNKSLLEFDTGGIQAGQLGLKPVPAGGQFTLFESTKPAVLKRISLTVKAQDQAGALRSTILIAEFDGEQTVWCPVSDFFGSGVGVNALMDRYRHVSADGLFQCVWPMPYSKSAKISLLNLGKQDIQVGGIVTGLGGQKNPSQLMHFHANWHYEYPIHAYGGRGTKDWNYIEIQGKGVYAGDTLAVMNPVAAWWGEGDEKIYVDGEKFPSHFGTGTEDYYGYAWCWPVKFEHPFHAQPRVDGNGKNNWGHTTVTRVRALDAIPFTQSLKFDMEIWHWRECDEAYAATTYWYAFPGATSNRPPQPEEATKPIPQPPPPFKISGAIECEAMEVASKSDAIHVGPQGMEGFAHAKWSGESHLWVQATKPGDFVELRFPAEGPRKVTLHATKSWDYGIVQFSINGKKAGEPVDLCSGEKNKCAPTGPIDLGVFEPKDGKMTLRAEVVGANPKAEGTK
jgi:D-arabinan exo alpha-(1,3)/(1,5)-arabinofuranosidase (non-reducing end)